MNFAAVRKLPVVFFCNHNQYAYSTPLGLQMAVKDVVDRAKAYGMPGEIVDGNDLAAVYLAARPAIQKARAGNAPTVNATTSVLVWTYPQPHHCLCRPPAA